MSVSSAQFCDHQEFKRSSIDEESIFFKYVNFVYHSFALILRIDLHAPDEHYDDRRKFRSAARHRWRIGRRPKWWFCIPELILIAYIGSNIHLGIYLAYQYEYDLGMFQLNKLIHRNDTREYRRLVDRVRGSELMLKQIGGPHTHLSFLVGQAYTLMIATSWVAYLFLMLYYQFGQPYDCYIVNDVLDYQKEAQKSDRLLELVLKDYSKSWEFFRKECYDRDCLLHVVSKSQLAGVIQKQPLGSEHLLWSLKEAGHFRALNRSCEWINRRIKFQFIWFNFLFIIGSATVCFIMIKLYTSKGGQSGRGEEIQAESALSIWMIGFEFTFICWIALVSVAFYASNLFLMLLDQVHLVNGVQCVVKSCLRSNSYLFAKLSKQLGAKTILSTKDQPVRLHMNLNLLLALLQFKIFLAQLNSSVLRMSKIFTVPVLFMLIFPIFFRLHLNYAGKRLAEFQLFAYTISLVISTAANMVLVPLCIFNSGCLKLYKFLGYLLAHTIEVGSSLGGQGDRQDESNGEQQRKSNLSFYDGHTLVLLNKELSHPIHIEQRFATQTLGLTCTYGLLCRLDFWFGVIMLSIWMASGSSSFNAMKNAKLSLLF